MKTRYAALAAVIIALSAVVSGCAAAPPAPAAPTAVSPGKPTGLSPDPSGAGVSVLAVLDGDTFDAAIGDALVRVRVLGINAPERSECLGDRSAVQLAALLAHGKVQLVRDVSDRDRYDRLLRYVQAGSTDLGEAMISAGHALAVATAPDIARAQRYAAAQREAREAGRGIWAPAACGPVSPASEAIVVSALHPDAAGRDEQNLNDEWVELTNHSAALIELGGFTVRDESSSNRYSLPARFALAAGASVRLHSGCGPDRGDTLYWCSRTPVWNNGGDTVLLLDANGNIVAARSY